MILVLGCSGCDRGPRLPAEDDSKERRELRLAAAKAAVGALAGPDADLGARMQAVQLVCAHGAALDWQARTSFDEGPLRRARVDVRVGDYDLDNGNFDVSFGERAGTSARGTSVRMRAR